MCVACTEYIKNKMTTFELKSAVKEASRENPTHLGQVEKLIEEHSDDPEELKRLLKPLETNKKDY